MSPEIDAFAVHPLALAQHHDAAAMGANSTLRGGGAGGDGLLIVEMVSDFHYEVSFCTSLS